MDIDNIIPISLSCYNHNNIVSTECLGYIWIRKGTNKAKYWLCSGLSIRNVIIFDQCDVNKQFDLGFTFGVFWEILMVAKCVVIVNSYFSCTKC